MIYNYYTVLLLFLLFMDSYYTCKLEYYTEKNHIHVNYRNGYDISTNIPVHSCVFVCRTRLYTTFNYLFSSF